MNIARPATGFLIEEPDSFGPYLRGFSNKWPRVGDHWQGIKERLMMTAHKEGVSLGHPLHRIFEALGSIEGQFPTIRVAYFVFANTLTFIAIVVIEPED